MSNTLAAIAAPPNTYTEARAATQILEHAARIGLPLPAIFTVTGSGLIVFQFDTLPEITDWALWMEAPVEEQISHLRVLRTVRGVALEHTVHLKQTETGAAR